MVKFMEKIPAGTFLVPMLLSAFIYTFWPDLIQIGGVTQAFLGGDSVAFMIGAITFCSGIGIDVKSLGKLFKRHGIIMLVKLALAIGLSLLFMSFFGQEGILGISALAFTVVMCSINPAIYIAAVGEYGDDLDEGAFGLTGLFSIPAIPMFIYGLAGSGDIDWMPIISTIIPLILGIILGNLDHDFDKIFGSGITLLIPLLGWNIGQGMNLIDAFQSGIYGIVLVVVFYIVTSLLVVTDKTLLKNDGIVAMSMNTVAGSSASFPAIVALANPAVEPYVTSAAAQILTVAIITIILTPILVGKLSERNQKIKKA